MVAILLVGVAADDVKWVATCNDATDVFCVPTRGPWHHANFALQRNLFCIASKYQSKARSREFG